MPTIINFNNLKFALSKSEILEGDLSHMYYTAMSMCPVLREIASIDPN